MSFIEVVDVAKCVHASDTPEAGNCVRAVWGQDGFYVDCGAQWALGPLLMTITNNDNKYPCVINKPSRSPVNN